MGQSPNWSIFLNSNHRGWILEGMAIESARAAGITPNFNYLPVSRRELVNFRLAKNRIFPKFSRHNLFMHQDIFASIWQKQLIAGLNNSVFVTHLTESFENYSLLANADLVLVQNQSVREVLIDSGVRSENIRVVFGAVDHSTYFPSSKFDLSSKPFVLITSHCKPRKNPEGILRVVREYPELDFVIHGKGWGPFVSEKDLKLKNLRLIDFNLELNPRLMREASAFLSLSSNEGGPISLLEALASGTPCVATATGFAPELITRDRGSIVPVNYDLENVGIGIRQAISSKRDLWNRDLLDGGFGWEELGSHFFSGGYLP